MNIPSSIAHTTCKTAEFRLRHSLEGCAVRRAIATASPIARVSLLAVLLLCANTLVTSPSAAQTTTLRTKVVLLGTGTPNPDPNRQGPAVAIVVDSNAYIVDAGAGVVRQAAAAEQNGLAALTAKNLRTAFLTHLHSDHTLGLADLILTPWVLEREEPLELYGPPGTAAMSQHIIAAYDADIRNRIDGLQPIPPNGYRVNAHDIPDGGVIFDDGVVRVTAVAVDHGSWNRAYGYRFDTPDRSIMISGDARPSESIVTACNGCDILIHEAYAQWGFDRREPEWQRYHAQAHTSGPDLGVLATRANPGLLVLYHQLLWGATPEQLLAEVRAGFRGLVVFGKDLDVF